MTIAASTALSTYSYQSTQATTSRANAVFQVLAQAYSNSKDTSSDPLASLISQTNNAPLVSAIYTQGKALQAAGTADADSTATGLLGLNTSQLAYGLTSASSSDLSQLLGDSTTGLSGFGSATSGGSTLALLAAQAQKAYGAGNLTADAKAQASTNAAAADNASGTGSSTSQTYLLQAAAAAQLAAMNNTFTLLA